MKQSEKKTKKNPNSKTPKKSHQKLGSNTWKKGRESTNAGLGRSGEAGHGPAAQNWLLPHLLPVLTVHVNDTLGLRSLPFYLYTGNTSPGSRTSRHPDDCNILL